MKKTLTLLVSLLVPVAILSQSAVLVAPRLAEAKLFIGCNEETIKDSKGNFVAFKDPCDFGWLIKQINAFISFLLFDLAMPLAAIIFAYAGWLYMSSGGSGSQIEKAKGLFKKVLIGFIIALAAWLIVKTIMLGLGVSSEYDTFYLDSQ